MFRSSCCVCSPRCSIPVGWMRVLASIPASFLHVSMSPWSQPWTLPSFPHECDRPWVHEMWFRSRQIRVDHPRPSSGRSPHFVQHVKMKPKPSLPDPKHAAMRLVACACTIYVAYLAQGIVQENLAVAKYGSMGKKLPHVVVLNLLQAVGAALTAAILNNAVRRRRSKSRNVHRSGNNGDAMEREKRGAFEQPSNAPIWAFVPPALSNSIGPACGVVALRYIPYPAQVLAKSCKMLPVMAMGVLVGRKRYATSEYLCGMMVSMGIALFALFKPHGGTASKLETDNAPMGYALCLVNLLMDGYTNAAQDKIHDRYRNTSALDMMFWMNIWGSCIMSTYFYGFTSIGSDTNHFVVEHPKVLQDMALFCACGIIGQLGIFYTIQEFGSLVATIVTTTRKFFSILLSVVWYGNALITEQWMGVFLVFSGLMGNIWIKQQKRRKQKAKDD